MDSIGFFLYLYLMFKVIYFIVDLCWAAFIFLLAYAQITLFGFTWWVIPFSIVGYLFGLALLIGIRRFMRS